MTEAIRVVSSESDAWVRSMDDEKTGGEERRGLFGEAVRRHGRDARMAGSGLGVDRHLLGESFKLCIPWVGASVNTNSQA